MKTITYKVEHNGSDSEFPFDWEVNLDGELYYSGSEPYEVDANRQVASHIADYLGCEVKEEQEEG